MMNDLMPWNKKENEHPLMALRKNMDQMFEDLFHGFPSLGTWPLSVEKSDFIPRLDVDETDREIHVNAELPGMTEKDIDVTLGRNVLSIKGEKKQEEEKKDKNYHRIERRYGSFYREIPLPGEVDAEKIKANFKNGILSITLPKVASVEKGTRIKIGTE